MTRLNRSRVKICNTVVYSLFLVINVYSLAAILHHFTITTDFYEFETETVSWTQESRNTNVVFIFVLISQSALRIFRKTYFHLLLGKHKINYLKKLSAYLKKVIFNRFEKISIGKVEKKGKCLYIYLL